MEGIKGVKMSRTKTWQAERALTQPGPKRFSTPIMLPPAIAPLSLVLLALAFVGSTTTIMGIAAVAVFFLGGVLLWRPGESPILLFIFAYQWLQVVVGIFYAGWLGIDLDDYSIFHGDMQMAATLSLIGLTLLICGMRLGAGAAQQEDGQLARLAVSRLQMKNWFWLYFAFWMLGAFAVAAALVVPGLSQPLLALSSMRWAFFVILTYAAFCTGVRSYWLIAFALELVSSFGSYFSDFKTVFFFTIFGLVASQLRLKLRDYLGLAVLTTCMLMMGIVWSDIKMEYRRSGGGIGTLVNLVSQIDSAGMSNGLDRLIRRVGYIEFFAAVVNHVPNVVPYTKGAIWADAISRPFMPRILSPEKTIIDDSARTNLYTGLHESGLETGTSISIGYMGETYVDFGPFWMMPVIGGLGYFIGRIYRHLLRSPASRGPLGMGLATAVLFQTAVFERSITKEIGAIIVTLLVSWTLVRFVIPTLAPWAQSLYSGELPGGEGALRTRT
jgi:hypothetical protein